MRSVADALREETRRRVRSLTPEARVRLALDLGDKNLAALCEARQLSPAAAKQLLTRTRSAGRRPSCANDD